MPLQQKKNQHRTDDVKFLFDSSDRNGMYFICYSYKIYKQTSKFYKLSYTLFSVLSIKMIHTVL